MTSCTATSRTRCRGRDSCERDGGKAGKAPRQAPRDQRPDSLRASPRLDAQRTGGDRDSAGRRLPDHLRRRPLTQELDLRFPDEGGFIGLDNYGTVLSSSLWWQDLANTVLIAVISVAIELTLGMAIALTMNRAIFGRGAVRTSVLIPYGIVTVVAAFAWQFAFAPGRLRQPRSRYRQGAGSGATPAHSR